MYRNNYLGLTSDIIKIISSIYPGIDTSYYFFLLNFGYANYKHEINV